MSDLTLGIVTDLHFGPDDQHQGKRRKLGHRAGALTAEFVRAMTEEARPDLVVNLGDDIQDQGRDADLALYGECQALLRQVGVPVVNVAGNHDLVNLGPEDLNRIWGRTGPLHYSLDRGGWHLVVLHTVEKVWATEIHVPEAQKAWLADDLARAAGPAIVLMHHAASEQDLGDSRWFAGHPEAGLLADRAAVRRIFERSGKVRAVLNGHLHRNHFDVIAGIPYITVQSLTENLDDDGPGRPARAHAVVRLSATRMVVRVRGEEPARYQVEFAGARG